MVRGVCISTFLCDRSEIDGGGAENGGSERVGSNNGEIVMIGGKRGEGGRRGIVSDT